MTYSEAKRALARSSWAILISLALAITGCVSSAATMEPAGPAAQPMDNANRIIIRTQDAPIDAYRRAARLLQDEGYALANSDETLLSLSTEYRERRIKTGIAAGSPYSIQLTARVDESEEGGSEVTFQWNLRSGGTGAPIEKIDFGVSRRAWEHFHNVTTQFDGRVLYARQ